MRTTWLLKGFPDAGSKGNLDEYSNEQERILKD